MQQVDICCGGRHIRHKVDRRKTWAGSLLVTRRRAKQESKVSRKLIQLLLEVENVLKSTCSRLPSVLMLIKTTVSCTAPWMAHINEIKAVLAVHVEAERKVETLMDKMQGLVHTACERADSAGSRCENYIN